MRDLKKEVLKAQESGDIAKLYVLEQRAQDELGEDELMRYYSNILELALERLTDVLEKKVRMDMNDVQDFATLRALYEYAVEHYSAGGLHDASALFEVLSGLSHDKAFSDAMKIHQKAADAKMSLDDFINQIADIEATQSAGTFYVSVFTNEAQKLLSDSKKSAEK
ncbi:hypothetical protein [Sulfurimonas sp. HSL-1716]|uniref:hypothetical protein n=1 Tax=Hydrocurvibacter sulfurireducens TaxID=3131937 RepID=UPI0031F8263E